jgi:tetratricopeptide (TPR) repeat protein
MNDTSEYRELMRYAARLVSLGDMAGALSVYREAIVTDPHCAAAYLKAGMLLQCTGHPEDATILLERASSLDDGSDADVIADAPYQSLLAQAGEYLALGDPQGAEDTCARAITMAPQRAEAYYVTAMLHWSQQHPLQAAYAMEKVARLCSTDPLAWNGLGVAYQAAGMVHEAIDAFAQAVVLDPECETAWNSLKEAYLIAGDTDSAALAQEHCDHCRRKS